MKEGEIVRYDFEVYADETLIDTTSEERAREHEIHNEEGEYGSQFAIVGMEGMYPGLKDAIVNAEEGGDGEAEVEAKDAFGERNPRNLDYRRYSDVAYIAQKQEKEVERGVKLEIDGRIAVISLVTPSRVRLDYNHEYAGKKIISKVKILEVLKESDDIIRAIIQMNAGDTTDFEFTEEDGVLSIKVPSNISLGLDWTTVKLRVVTQLRKHTGIKNIRYIEEFFQKTDIQDEVVLPSDDSEDANPGDGDDEVSQPTEDSNKDEAEEIAEEDPASETTDTSDENINVTVGSAVAVAEPEME